MIRQIFWALVLHIIPVVLLAQNGPPQSTPAQAGINYPIIACRMPTASNTGRNVFPDTANFSLYIGRGTQLIRLNPNGSVQVLFDPGPLGACADPVLSFDGGTVWFTVFVDPQDINTQRGVSRSPAHIWRLNLQTLQATQVTFGVEPVWTDTTHGVDAKYAQFDVAPTPLPDGRILFLSNREATISSVKSVGKLLPAMKFWRMDADGSNLELMERFTQGACQHPVILADGRIVWTHFHPAGNRSRAGGNHILMVANQDLSDATIFAGDHSRGTSWHFTTQLSGGDIVTTVYYHFNNFGHGTLVRFPVDPGHSSGQVFGPLSSSTASYQINGVTDHFPRVGQTLATPWSLQPTTPSLSYDKSSVILPDGTRAGKSTMPSAAPNGDMIMIWSSGNVNALNRPVSEEPHMKIVLAPGGNLPQRDDMIILLEDPAWQYMYPRPEVPYAAIHGIPQPPIRMGSPNDGSEIPSVLPANSSFATTGTSSVYNRESEWPITFNDDWDINLVNNFRQQTARFTVGQDTKPFNNADIHAAQIVVDMTTQDLRYIPGMCCDLGFRSHTNGRQVWGILGEIPLRKFDSQGQEILDPQGNPDTSYEVRIPALTPYHHRILDQNGLTLSSEMTWHSSRPGERKINCGGCHAHSTDTDPLAFALTAAADPNYQIEDFALQTPMIDKDSSGNPTVTIMPEKVRVVEYHRDVRPIFQAKCISCHGDQNPAANLDLQGDDAADALAFDDPTLFGGHQATRWVRKLSASQSLLAWKVFGQRLDGRSNSDRSDDVDYIGDSMPPPNSGVPPLTFAEKRTIGQWIDLGCLTNNTPSTTAVGNVHDDLMKPTLTVRLNGGEGSQRLPLEIGSLSISALDVHSDLDPNSLVVTVTAEGGPTSGNLASTTTLSDGQVINLSLPPLAVGLLHRIQVSVADTAGNIARQQIDITPRELILERDPLERGTVVSTTVRGAAPGETVYFLTSTAGVGTGPIVPILGNLVLDLILPIEVFGSAIANGSGEAQFNVFLPPWYPTVEIAGQAVIARPLTTSSLKTNTVTGVVF